MTDKESKLGHVLTQLEEKRISTADAAAQVRQLRFPAKPAKPAWKTVEDDATGDPEVHPLGGAFELSRAYVTGRIDHAQYEALAQAVSDAMKAQASGT